MKRGCFIDCHVHSRFSFDSESEINDICASAAANGLAGVTITDHCEVCVAGMNEYWTFESMCASYEAARQADGTGGMRVFAGVELGQPHHHPETARQALAQCDYDCVLGSVHFLRDGSDFYYLDYLKENDPYEVYSAYLAEMRELVGMDCFDVLAHMTYPLRYIVGRDCIDFDEKPFYADYDAILSTLAANGRALEINTSGGRNTSFILPDVYIASRFRELGGKYVTLGSDAHRADGVGGNFDAGLAIARAAGFDRIVYYKEHVPQEVLI